MNINSIDFLEYHSKSLNKILSKLIIAFNMLILDMELIPLHPGLEAQTTSRVLMSNPNRNILFRLNIKNAIQSLDILTYFLLNFYCEFWWIYQFVGVWHYLDAFEYVDGQQQAQVGFGLADVVEQEHEWAQRVAF